MTVVADTNVIVSAVFWPGESRRCLALWAKRRFNLAITLSLFEEYTEVAQRMRKKVQRVNPKPWLSWIESKAKIYEPFDTGKQRSRDRDDDQILACALASKATIIISKDADLLVLGKPVSKSSRQGSFLLVSAKELVFNGQPLNSFA